ncbi:cation acetate symporter, partial [Candidatus Falkowbacteria bacterium]|nr:cation acetate symporter [Candidatus Falkowbacteria bacterium]
VLGFAAPIFPWDQYALFSMSAAFFGIWFFSVTDRSARAALDKAGYPAQFVRSETGLGAAGALAH